MACRICKQCFYCDCLLSVRHEHDHFPVPKRAGGVEIVPICLNCHDLKDRTLINNSDPGLMLRGLFELIDGRLAPFEFSPANLPAVVEAMGDVVGRWDDLSFEARLVYAKLRAAVEDMALSSTNERDQRGTGSKDRNGLA